MCDVLGACWVGEASLHCTGLLEWPMLDSLNIWAVLVQYYAPVDDESPYS